MQHVSSFPRSSLNPGVSIQMWWCQHSWAVFFVELNFNDTRGICQGSFHLRYFAGDSGGGWFCLPPRVEFSQSPLNRLNPISTRMLRGSVTLGGAYLPPPLSKFSFIHALGMKLPTYIRDPKRFQKIFGSDIWRHYFADVSTFVWWCHSMEIYRKMTYDVIKWRHHVGYLPNFQEMFI